MRKVCCKTAEGEQGVSENAFVSAIAGDFRRMDPYAKPGYQLPREIPEKCWEAYRTLVEMGYGK